MNFLITHYMLNISYWKIYPIIIRTNIVKLFLNSNARKIFIYWNKIVDNVFKDPVLKKYERFIY